jgi:signal transduction histidine kinase
MSAGGRTAQTPWQALGSHPIRLLVSPWPWRSLAYLLTSAPVALMWLVSTAVLAGAGLAGALVVVGLPLLAGAGLAGMPLGMVERARLRLMQPTRPAASPHRRVDQPGPWHWLTVRLGERATWRELAYGLLLLVLGIADLVVATAGVGLVVLPLLAPLLRVLIRKDVLSIDAPNLVGSNVAALVAPVAGVVALLVVPSLVTAYAAGRAAFARAFLVGPTEDDLRTTVVELTRSRARIADAFDTERRRIERDLHDGAQQRLTSLIMTLGLARLETSDGPPAPRDLVATAHDQARQTLDELRALVRGIHPPVLTDRGLGAALMSLTDRCQIPVEVDTDLPARLPQPVETTAYFVVSEALANVAKHSGASRAAVSARHDDDVLVVEIRDDGRGGADQARGSGLTGLVDRVAALGGGVRLSSPRGGPTVLHVEIPCGS